MLSCPWVDFWSYWLQLSDWCLVHRVYSSRNDQWVTAIFRRLSDRSAYLDYQDYGNAQERGSHRNEPSLRPQRVLQVPYRQKDLMEKCTFFLYSGPQNQRPLARRSCSLPYAIFPKKTIICITSLKTSIFWRIERLRRVQRHPR